MSRKRRVFLVLIPVAVALAVLQYVANRNAMAFLRGRVIPKVEQALGTTVSVEKARASLLAASVGVDGVTIANPPDFAEPALARMTRSRVRLSIPRFITGTIGIAKARLEQVAVTVERTESKAINTRFLHGVGSDVLATGTVKEARGPSRSVTSEATRRILVKDFAADVLLHYVDRELSKGKEPFRLDMALRVSAQDVATFARSRQGAFRVSGHLAGNPDAFRTEIAGTLGALTDPKRPDFDLCGRMEAIDPAKIEPLVNRVGIGGDSASIDLRVVCREGVYQKSESVAEVRFKNPRLAGKLASKLPGLKPPRDFVLRIPIGGTYGAADFDIETGFVRSVLAAYSGKAVADVLAPRAR